MRQKLLRLLLQLDNCSNVDALNTADGLIDRALMTTETIHPATHFPAAPNYPTNKGITPQKPFFSTKRKRTTTNIRLAKPTNDQTRQMIKDLLQGLNVHSTSLFQDVQGNHIA